jgi:oligoribonuclease (3'-5' exoribonuclease)
MNSVILKIIILFFSSFSIVYAADTNSVENFPQKVQIEYNNESINLERTGFTVRKKFFLKIYSMAHYVEQIPEKTFSNDEIYQYMLQQYSIKQISMVFLRSLKAEQIQESLISGIKLNTNEQEYEKMLPQIEVFMHAIYEDVKENDEFILRWLPDGTMVSLFQGKEISSIKDENFARTLWSIWFGDYSVVKRDMLIKELLTSS